MNHRGFSERLRALRIAAKLTQGELAERCGLNWQTIAAFEQGRRKPRLDTAAKLADCLGVSLDQLAGR